MPATQTLLSPSELSYIHRSLSLTPPLRPDGRTTTQFRPLTAEQSLLPSTNGSARVCWAEGEECLVGVRCDVEATIQSTSKLGASILSDTGGEADWVSLSIEIPGFRDDDSLPVFLGSLLSEALVQSGFLAKRLMINRLWHWRVYIDILLLSPPQAYPLPLLSITTHLALLDTQLPRLISEGDEDPLFDDDWAAAVSLYSSTIPLSGPPTATAGVTPTLEADPKPNPNPPITLLTTTISEKIFFDPSREELAVADAVIALTFSSETASGRSAARKLKLLSIRTIDSPARLTTAGVPDEENTTVVSDSASANTTATATAGTQKDSTKKDTAEGRGIWTPPSGGISRALIGRIVGLCIGDEAHGIAGVAGEVFDGLERLQGLSRRG